MELSSMGSTGIWIVVVLLAITVGVGIWAYRYISAQNKPLRERKQAMESELRAAEDRFHAEQQRFERASVARPVFLPEWAERKASELHGRIGNSHAAAKWKLLDVSYDIGNCEFDSARTHLGAFEQSLDAACMDISELAGIEQWVERYREEAREKSEMALLLAASVEMLGKTMSDQGIMLEIGEFDALSAQALLLRAFIASDSCELLSDRSDEILYLGQKLATDAEKLRCKLEYLVALRAYVPKLIAEHQGRPIELMSRNSDAVRTFDRIKSFSADHLWYDLGQRLKEVPGMLSQAKQSLALALEMHAAQSWYAAKQEAEAAVALIDDAELVFDEISDLDARLAAAQETAIRTFGETKIVVTTAIRMTEDRDDVGVKAKQLALRALSAFERASYLISVTGAFDHLGAVESLGYAREFAEAAIDRAKLDTVPPAEAVEPAPEPVRCFGGPYGVAGAGITD